MSRLRRVGDVLASVLIELMADVGAPVQSWVRPATARPYQRRRTRTGGRKRKPNTVVRSNTNKTTTTRDTREKREDEREEDQRKRGIQGGK